VVSIAYQFKSPLLGEVVVWIRIHFETVLSFALCMFTIVTQRMRYHSVVVQVRILPCLQDGRVGTTLISKFVP